MPYLLCTIAPALWFNSWHLSTTLALVGRALEAPELLGRRLHTKQTPHYPFCVFIPIQLLGSTCSCLGPSQSDSFSGAWGNALLVELE